MALWPSWLVLLIYLHYRESGSTSLRFVMLFEDCGTLADTVLSVVSGSGARAMFWWLPSPPPPFLFPEGDFCLFVGLYIFSSCFFLLKHWDSLFLLHLLLFLLLFGWVGGCCCFLRTV